MKILLGDIQSWENSCPQHFLLYFTKEGSSVILLMPAELTVAEVGLFFGPVPGYTHSGFPHETDHVSYLPVRGTANKY